MNVLRLIGARALALSAISLVLLGAVVWQGIVLVGHDRADGRRADAIDVAQAQVLDLTTLDSSSVNDKLQAMGARVTGSFKDQFDGFEKTFASVVSNDKIRATGTIKSAALSAYGEGTATVLVASTADVTTGAKTKPTQRSYRVSVDLSRINGAWLISGMEFVQ